VAFGRAEIVDRVARSEARVLLLTGDSGIGKSTVLALASEERPGWIVSAPRTLPISSGGLYSSFLDGLGDVLVAMVEQGLGAPTLGEQLAATAQRLANEQATVLGRVAMAEVIAFIRGKVGDEVGKTITAYAREIWPDSADTLAAKAAQARDPLAVDVLSAFADAAVQLADGSRLAILLDQGQRLSEDDRRLLGDLAERLPEGSHVRVAFATDTAARTDFVSGLRAEVAAIDEVEVPPLEEEAVAEWVAAEGLAVDLAPAITSTTGGYPLLIEAAIVHLKQGGDMTDLPRHQQLAARTRVSWNALTPGAAAVGRKLAVLRDPLPEGELRQLAGIDDVGEWATVVQELQRARIFSVIVNRQPWFHRERREFVLNECLNEEQRGEAAARAAELVWTRLLTTADTALAAQFAELAAAAPSLLGSDPNLAAALSLEGPSLAVAGALLELVTGEGVVRADALFSHALRFVPKIDDPIAVVGELEERGLIVTASNDWMTVVALTASEQAQAAIQGRVSLALGKAAVPRLVEAVFRLALRDPLGEFESAHFGIGIPSLGNLARLAVGLDPTPGFGSGGYVDRRQLGTNLLIRGSAAEDVPLYCAASYTKGEARDAALEAAQELERNTPIGTVRITSAVKHPTGPVAVQRFAIAAARAAGRPNPSPRDTGGIKVPLPDGLSDELLADLRVRTAKVLRDVSTPIEQMALELDHGFLLAWHSEEKLWDECVVHGAGYGQRREPALAGASIDDRFEGLRLRQALSLQDNQAVVHRTIRAGESSRHEPIFDEIAYRRERARIFNSAQPQLRVVLDAESLPSVIEEGFLAELADARELQTRLPFPEPTPEISPRALWVLVVLDEPNPGFVAGARGMIWYSEAASPTEADQVRVEAVRGQAQPSEYLYTVDPGTFSEVFPEATAGAGTSTIDFAIARFLRHHPSDVALAWPDE
jgi:hypothetical protein